MLFLKRMVAIYITMALLMGTTVVNARGCNTCEGIGYEETSAATKSALAVGLFCAVVITATLIVIVNDCGHRGKAHIHA